MKSAEILFEDINDSSKKELYIEIYNSVGERVLMQTILGNTKTPIAIKDTDQLSVGIYFLSIKTSTGNTIYHSKVVKN